MLAALILATALEFGPPVNFPVTLAGNFGEPRPNHFHGGIDVRTGGVEGKPVLSVADGYVSRLTVGLYGFGNAVYVTHPNGTTTVYAHLKKFIPQLAAIARKWQYQNRNPIADVRLGPTDHPVAMGDLLAVSGNTGASKAPHLHLEFHETATWKFLDPLDYIGGYVRDGTPPMVHALMACPVEGEGVFCGGTGKRTFGFASGTLDNGMTAWGKVGFAFWANDYMEDSYGRLGVRHARLEVDGRVAFESDADSIPDWGNPLVNSWGDHGHYRRSGVWYMKAFIDPGNALPLLRADGSRGIVTFDEERPYVLDYTVTDAFGNSRRYRFTVRGKRGPIPPGKPRSPDRLLRHDRVSSFQRPGVSLTSRPGTLPDDVELAPRSTSRPGYQSAAWRFMGGPYPLMGRGATLSMRLEGDVGDTSKLYLRNLDARNGYLESRYEDGWVTAGIRDLGASYAIAYDDSPPAVSGLRQSGDRLYITTWDPGSGVASYCGYADGTFILFGPVDKGAGLSCDLGTSPVKRTGSRHEFRFTSTDRCGNTREYTSSFVY